MATLDTAIVDVFEGQTYRIARAITGIPAGDSLDTVWMTLKNSKSDADPGKAGAPCPT